MNKLFLDNLPTSPGVYKMLDIDKNIIYVGKAGNLKKRVSSYFMKSNHSVKNQRLIAKIRDIDYQILKLYNIESKNNKFKHGNTINLNTNTSLIASYHCSKLNFNTHRIDLTMLEQIFNKAKKAAGYE